MKSILIVTEQFTLGGLETHICGEILRLSDIGIEVYLVTGKAFDGALLPHGYSAVTHGLPLGPDSTPEELLFSVNEIRKIIRERSIGGVHIHPFTSIIPAAIAAELEQIPYAITLHGPVSLVGFYGPMYELLVKNLILPSAKLIVAVSPETEKILLGYADSESVTMIPNSVSFESSIDVVSSNVELDPHWLIVSRLDQFKIHGVLDFCTKGKLAGIPGVLVAGDGPARDDLSRLLCEHGLADYATLLGASSQVHLLMQKAAGVAGMGRVVLEAVAARKPVVLVGYDGIKGVIDTTLLASAAEENFSGRGLPTIESDMLANQIRTKATDLNTSAVYALGKSKFSDLTNWSLFLDQLRAAPASKSTSLTGLYNALSLSPIKGLTPFLFSSELLDRLESVICGKSYYDPRLTQALTMCRKRLHGTSLNQALSERDGQIAKLSQAVTDRDGLITGLNQALSERDGQIAELSQAVTDRDGLITGLNQALSERDGQIAELSQAVTDRDGLITGLNQALSERDGQIAKLSQAVADRDGLIHAAHLYKEDKEIYVAMLKYELEKINSRIHQRVFKSVSRLRRLPYYARRSVAVLKSRGFAGLLKVVASKLQNRAAGNSYSYIHPAVSVAPAPTDVKLNHSLGFSAQPLLGDALVIVTGVPFDDVGGGQRAAQIARCALKTGRSVIYLYIYKKFDFELNKYVESDVAGHGLIHKFIDATSPVEVLSLVSPEATLLIELPHKDALPYLQQFNSRGMRTVFELIDDWESSLGGDWFNLDVYRRFVKEATTVVGTAKVLVQKLHKLGRDDVIYLPNAANEYIFDKYKSYLRPTDLPSGVKRIALYFGSLYGEWFAWDYLQEAAATNLDIAFILIGDKPNSQSLPALPPNVHLLGAKQIHELPAYLAHSDLSLLPFLPGKISDAVSPIKVFEYLFSGSPVVATKLPEIIDYPGVSVANSPKEFALLCKEVTFTEESRRENDRFIFNNSWFLRLEKLVNLSEKTQFQNLVSGIILVHNNKSIIGRCLESLLMHCAPYLKEIIVVDNASVDGSAEFIESNFPSVHVVRNAANGCSSGRNLGVQMATGKFLAFFDSDQWFTSASGFEEALVVLNRDANVGVVGWAGGWFEAGRDDLAGMIADYCPNRAMNDIAIQRGYRSDIGYLGTGGFFVPTAVFNATEGFDVAYDPTCFEDTDMSFQIKKLGFDVCYRDLTGIRHQPHQTTKASSGSDAYSKLFQRNAEYFKKKWSAYPHFFIDYSH